jgi:CBS-domain-containing membrane protein
VIGIITHHNLAAHPHLPMRVSLLAKLEPKKVEEYLDRLPLFTAREIMSHPVITVEQAKSLHDAVQLMLKHNLKRMPVVDEQGKLVGFISRIDIFRAITKYRQRELLEEYLAAGSAKLVRDVQHREHETVHPETPIEQVVELLEKREIHRVAVVDHQHHLVGLISDFELLPLLGNHSLEEGTFISKRTSLAKGRQFKECVERMVAKTAGEVMNRKVVAIEEHRPVEEAIKLMTEKSLKRLPVVDEHGVFKGMISREHLLRTITRL